MEFHYNSIVIESLMPKNVQFSITLPPEAIEMIEQGLVPFGLYGKKRGTVCASLILDMLKQPAVRDIVREQMKKVRGREGG